MSDKSTSTRPPTIRYRPPLNSTLANPYNTSLLPEEITLYRTLDRGPAQYRSYSATAEIQSLCGFAGQSGFWAASGISMRDLKKRSRTVQSVTVRLSHFEPTNDSQNVLDENGRYQLTDTGEVYEKTWKIGRMKANAISATFEEDGKEFKVQRSQNPTFFEEPVFKSVKVTMGGAISAKKAGIDEDVVLQDMVEALVDEQE